MPPEERRQRRHVSAVKELTAPKIRDKAERGMQAQKTTRVRERDLKKRVIAVGRVTKQTGGTVADSARLLTLEPNTVRDWHREWQATRLPLEPRGRPPVRSDLETREGILSVLHDLGEQVGVPVLAGLFPDVPRRELESILIRFRRQVADQNSQLKCCLAWHQAGAVWAIDYTDPPDAVDGQYKDILVVRDLASGMELGAIPVPIETAAHTASALADLFIRHGAPLVIKRDNGGTLKAPPVAGLLSLYGVHVLPSPVRKPQYNGSCEAGNGSLKTTAHHVAARNGRPGQWTCDDVEEARRLINATARPHGPKGPPPEVTWDARRRISAKERKNFRREVTRRLAESRRAAAEAFDTRKNNEDESPMMGYHDDTHMRRAVRKTLESRGFLSYSRKVIST